jgi:ParB-like chromosome segregation protein Spo0J
MLEHIRPIRIECIMVDKRLRPLSEKKVIELADSIKQIGLISPIVIRYPNGAMVPHLVAGAHRLAAVKDLGWEEVPCVTAPEEDADRAALIEIDENLVRGELSAAQRAIHIDRRKEIYERLHPKTRHGATGRVGKKELNLSSFSEATAKRTGRSRASVKRDATRAKCIPQIANTVGTSLDEPGKLDLLAKLPAAKQAELIERAKAGEDVTFALKAEGARRNKKVAPTEEEQAMIENVSFDTVFVPSAQRRKSVHSLTGSEALEAAKWLYERAGYLRRLAELRRRREDGAQQDCAA